MTRKSRIDTLQGYARRSARISLTWEIGRTGNGATVVAFKGEIDENADLQVLALQLEGTVVLDLGEVRRINSAGVREWVNFMRELGHVKQVWLSRCSTAIVNQLNMIYNFRGRASVKTFFAPYLCVRCETEVDVLLDTNVHFPDKNLLRPPEVKCPQCGQDLDFDDIPQRYFSFVPQT